jgi:hypothetical protein
MTVPFNLSAFDESIASGSPEGISRTATKVQDLCYPLLYKPSKEGEYAALALARLYARPDCRNGLQPFLAWIRSELEKQDGQDDGLEAIFVSECPVGICRSSTKRLTGPCKPAGQCSGFPVHHSRLAAFGCAPRQVTRLKAISPRGFASTI